MFLYNYLIYLLFLNRLQSAIRQLDRAEDRAKQKPQKPKKNKEFTAMHVSIIMLTFI